MPVKKTLKTIDIPEAATAAPETKTKAPKRTAAPKTAAATHKNAAPRATRAVKASPVKPAFDPALHHDEIAREAYMLWEARGYGDGNATQDWLSAIEIVRTRHQ